MKKLPIGIQTFRDIREEGYCYVDKTLLVHRLVTQGGKAYFLLRPRLRLTQFPPGNRKLAIYH